MEIVIGLGGIGCRLARQFEKYPQYEVYKIDSEKSEEENYFQIPSYKTPEDYEARPPKIKNFLRTVSGRILFIVCGASKTAAASLVILEQIHKRCAINVLYIQPELSLLSEVKMLQQRSAFNIFQQYARSAVFEKIYLVSNEEIDPLVEDASIAGYYDSINELIVRSFHMVNIFDHSDSLTNTFSMPLDVSRIATLGLLDTRGGTEKMFFPLDSVRETRYYYGIPDKKIKKEKKLHRKIVNQVKEKAGTDTKVSFGIYSTNYEYDCGYVLSFSSAIQESS